MSISWLSPVVCRVEGDPWGEFGHWCPGCNRLHEIAVETANPSGARWSFDGNLLLPTLSPSINCRSGRFLTAE